MSPTTYYNETKTRDGLRLRFAHQGRPGAAALLMLHGYTDSSFSFSRVLPLFGRDMHVIVPDQRGHGDSEKPMDAYWLNSFARDAIDLLDSLSVSQATVVGHSMGSMVAQRLAIIAPERVSRLVLAGSAPTQCNPQVLELAEAVEELRDPVPESFVREFQMSTIHRTVPPEFLDRVVSESLKLPAHIWKAILSSMIRGDWKSDLSAIRCSTLILWGDRDLIFSRAEQELLLQLIPRATLHIQSDVGHAPHWETPEDFARAILAFVEQKPTSVSLVGRDTSDSVETIRKANWA